MLPAALLPLKPQPWLLMDYSQAWPYQLEKQIGKKQDVNQSFFKDNREIEEAMHILPEVLEARKSLPIGRIFKIKPKPSRTPTKHGILFALP